VARRGYRFIRRRGCCRPRVCLPVIHPHHRSAAILSPQTIASRLRSLTRTTTPTSRALAADAAHSSAAAGSGVGHPGRLAVQTRAVANDSIRCGASAGKPLWRCVPGVLRGWDDRQLIATLGRVSAFACDLTDVGDGVHRARGSRCRRSPISACRQPLRSLRPSDSHASPGSVRCCLDHGVDVTSGGRSAAAARAALVPHHRRP